MVGGLLVWIGAAVPGRVVAPIAVAGVVTGAAGRNKRALVAAVLLLLGLHSGTVARRSGPERPIEPGPLTVVAIAVSDPAGPPERPWLVVDPRSILDGDSWSSWEGPRVLVRGPIPVELAAGEPVLVSGTAGPADFRVRSGPVGGVIEADGVARLGSANSALFRLGNRLRSHVLGGLRSVATRPEGALLSGFLIGDVRRLPESDVEALRLAGLSHFVAVSGSNVALFLVAWWLATAPLGWGPRGRSAVGLLGLGVFVVVTRWEPSVIRAATMAGIVLVGRLGGFPVRPWTALGVAVGGLVAFDGSMIGDVGFQLSVAATAGILLGTPLSVGRRPRWLWTILVATSAAQAAVAPLLLHHFGSVPLLAPATNLVAAPLVAGATTIGGIGAVVHAGGLVGVGTGLAALVLAIARGAAGLPQLGVGAVAGLGLVGLTAVRFRPVRPVAAVGAVVLVLASLVPAPRPSGPTVWFLDVGQGDSALLMGPSGEVVLIDGGPDPAVLRGHLRELGVRRISLLVVSHRHADHSGGLEGVTAVARVDRMWHPPQLGEGSPLDALVVELGAAGAVVETPAVGTRAKVGAFSIEVLGPLRRYVSPNDGSLVLRIEAAGISVLFSGDIEAVAQADLGPLPAEVLKVPHQGSLTSDLGWLAVSAPRLAVISVGPNDFGHPSLQVVDVLEGAGTIVRRTDEEGTIVVRLDRLAALPSAP